jgi:hypothetical protein
VATLTVSSAVSNLLSRRSPRELVARMKLLSPPAREVLSADRWEPCPPTWLAVADLKRIRHNSTVVAKLMACYRRVIPACTDEDSVGEMNMTHRTAIRERTQLSLGLLRVLVHLCFGPIGRSRCRADMANVGRHYVNVLLLGQEIVEVLDESCVPIMEEQFLQGLSWQLPSCVNRTAK